jgi:hypothetical protein
VLLRDESFLTDELLKQLMAMGEVDILVGMATYNNVGTVAHALGATQAAFARYFHRERTALIVADAGSRDGTLGVVRRFNPRELQPLLTSQSLRTVHQIAVPYHGVPGKANALRTIFAAADLARAKVCLVVGADHDRLTPEWIERLVGPVRLEEFDFVSPLYQRHKFDGLLPKNLLYPVMGSLFGLGIREPLGGENAFSSRLVEHLLGQRIWEGEMARLGIDLGVAAATAVGGFRVCELALGRRPASRGEPVAVGAVVEQVVGSLFACLETHETYWQTDHSKGEIQVKGSEPEPADERLRISRKPMFDRLRSAVVELGSVLEKILAADTLNEIRALTGSGEREIHYPDELWVRTVYDFAAAYHRSVMHRGHLLQAMTPLYLGRVGSFVLENLESDAAEVDRRLLELSSTFGRLKTYLRQRWSATGE